MPMPYQSKVKRAVGLAKSKRSTPLRHHRYISMRSSLLDRDFLSIHAPLSKTSAKEVRAYIQELRKQNNQWLNHKLIIKHVYMKSIVPMATVLYLFHQ